MIRYTPENIVIEIPTTSHAEDHEYFMKSIVGILRIATQTEADEWNTARPFINGLLHILDEILPDREMLLENEIQINGLKDEGKERELEIKKPNSKAS
jgi:hypothetical protein